MARTPTYKPHGRLTFSGYFGVQGKPVDTWSINFSISRPGAGGYDVINFSQGTVEDYAADFTKYVRRPDSHWPKAVRFTSAKLALIDAQGKSNQTEPLYAAVDVAGPGEPDGPWTGSVSYPPQCALVASLNDAASNRRHKGRVYLPAPIDQCVQDFHLQDIVVAQISTSMAQLVRDLNNYPGIDGSDARVCVASTFGDMTPVTSVRVGSRIDVVRSRAASLAERYQRTAV